MEKPCGLLFSNGVLVLVPVRGIFEVIIFFVIGLGRRKMPRVSRLITTRRRISERRSSNDTIDQKEDDHGRSLKRIMCLQRHFIKDKILTGKNTRKMMDEML